MTKSPKPRRPAKAKSAPQTTLDLGKRPTHRLYRALGDGDAASWTPVGAAWPNKDGKGFSIACDAVPLAAASFCGSSRPSPRRETSSPPFFAA